MTYFIWIVLFAYGAFFTTVAVLKLIKHPHMVKSIKEMQLPYGLAMLAGLSEVIAGPALIWGIWKPAFAGLGAIILIGTMIGAAIANYVGKDWKHALGVVLYFLLPMVLLAYYFQDAARQFMGI